MSEAEDTNPRFPYWHCNIPSGRTGRADGVSAGAWVNRPVHGHHLPGARGHRPSWPTRHHAHRSSFHPAQRRCPRYASAKAGGKVSEAAIMGIKGKFCASRWASHSPFRSLWNTPSSCLIKWRLVSMFAWLFSSLHHFEQRNLSNWYTEFFPVWLKQQISCQDSFVVVFAVSFRNHAKGV